MQAVTCLAGHCGIGVRTGLAEREPEGVGSVTGDRGRERVTFAGLAGLAGLAGRAALWAGDDSGGDLVSVMGTLSGC